MLHEPLPPTSFTAPAVLVALSALHYWMRVVPASFEGLLYLAAALVTLQRVLSFVFGRFRESPHAAVKLAPGKWRCSSWSGTHKFTPSEIYMPRTQQELLEVVEMCGRNGKKVKPAASLHSWSETAVTEDVSLNAGLLNKVLEVDKERMTIRAEAGIRLRDLYARMNQEGLALPCLPNVDSIQLGGAIANCTHGTCIETGSMASQVHELEIVVFESKDGTRGQGNGRAKLLRLRRDTEDEHERHLFSAAVVSFGSLGVFYSITLKCVPTFHCYVHELVVPFEEIRNQLKAQLTSHYSVRFMIFPLTGLVSSKIQVPVRGPLVRATHNTLLNSTDIVALKLVSFAQERNATTWLWLRRVLSHLVNKGAIKTASGYKSINRGHLLSWNDGELESRMHASFTTAPFVNFEYAVPLDRIDEAVPAIVETMRRYPVHAMSMISLRPVGADSLGYMAPPLGQAVVYVDIPYVENLERTGVYAEVEKVCLRFGGRCSWSRLLFSDVRDILKNFTMHDRFLEAKRELDPCNVFSNKFSDRFCLVGKN
jgi:L-gulonolactone oxidase